MKVYIVVDVCSGEDYSADDPTVLLVTTNKDDAKQFFDDEISNWEDGMIDFNKNVENYEDGSALYECTDFDGDSHRIMKLVVKEVEL